MPHSSLGGLARTVRRIPLWARWLGTLLAFALLIFAIHTVVRTSGASSEASPEAEINRVSEIVIAQDQAPHTAPLLPGDTARSGLQSAIAADVRNRIRREELTGPLQSVRCAHLLSVSRRRRRTRGNAHVVQARSAAREQRTSDRADQRQLPRLI
jgi:hypothetical protein